MGALVVETWVPLLVEERRGVSSNALLVEEASSSLDDVDNWVVVACLQEEGAVVVVPSCLRWGVGVGIKVVAAADSWLGLERRDFLDGTIV